MRPKAQTPRVHALCVAGAGARKALPVVHNKRSTQRGAWWMVQIYM